MTQTDTRATPDTRTRILDVAERLVQTRGFNGFSYADVATELGIAKPSLHYHFATKADLGEALIRRYAERFAAALTAIGERPDDARRKLDAYAALYTDVLRDQRMCLCGMLAAEYPTLPEPMREAVTAFFDLNESWLEQVLDAGRADGALRLTGPSEDAARIIVGGLEGAMLVARSHGDPARFETAAGRLIADVTGLATTH
ncbi:TetR/AcrR family transcriptional regulator [Cellulomonas sp. ICMP 17802]|uniref:TetR/AcrR family transcriptional regulator n=1 Tax=Cellulomonas sp. ICMP 17802 TaxID=3239199 RepID=UPI00351BB394